MLLVKNKKKCLQNISRFNEDAENGKVSPLVTQLSWANHLLIMSGCKTDEEREFYIRLAIKERYTKRQLGVVGATNLNLALQE